jgi:hydrogenase nickel incorporation protein HypB
MTTRLVEVRRNVLKQNDLVARDLRQRFQDAGVFVVSRVSSPGPGKTAFLEKTLTLLRENCRVAALVGDLATDNDAVRLARAPAPVKQITTGTRCHLEAAMVPPVTEGEDKPLKYPTIFNTADVVEVTKMDLAEAVEFDGTAADENIRRVRPGMEILKVSSKSGAGMEEWLRFVSAARTTRGGVS